MSRYFEEGSLYQLSPVRVKLESPETDRGESEDEMRVKDEEGEAAETASGRAGGGSGGLPFNVVVVHPSVVETGYSHHDNSSSAQPCPAEQAPKKRRMRFSEVEGHVVLTQVAERWDELHGQKSKFLYRGGKKQIWNDIARLVTAKSRRVRSGEDVRKKWTSEKKLLKEKGAGPLLHRPGCRGDPPEAGPPPPPHAGAAGPEGAGEAGGDPGSQPDSHPAAGQRGPFPAGHSPQHGLAGSHAQQLRELHDGEEPRTEPEPQPAAGTVQPARVPWGQRQRERERGGWERPPPAAGGCPAQGGAV